MEPGLQDLLNEFTDLELNEKTKRIRCKLSGHEMPCNIKSVESYVYGKRYKTLKTKVKVDVESLKPFIVKSELKKESLFCCLTGKHINNTRSQVDTHVKGAKYQLAKSQYDASLRELINEVKKKKEKKDNKKQEEEEEKEEEEEMEVDTPPPELVSADIKPPGATTVKRKVPPQKAKKMQIKKSPLADVVKANDKESLPVAIRKRKTDHSIMSRKKRMLLAKSKRRSIY